MLKMSVYISGNDDSKSLDSLDDVTGFSNAEVGKTYGLRKDKIGHFFKPVETSGAGSQINLSSGLAYNSQNQLGVVLEEPSGLHVTDNGLSIETGTLSSLEKTSSGLGVKTDLNGPLENGANGLTARQITNSGLSITNGLAVNIKTGGGLDIVNNELGIKIKPDGGLVLDSTGLSANQVSSNGVSFIDEIFTEYYDQTAFSKAREELINQTTPNPLAPPNLHTRTAAYTPEQVFRYGTMSDKYIDYIVNLPDVEIIFILADRRDNVNRSFTTEPRELTTFDFTIGLLNSHNEEIDYRYNFRCRYINKLFYFTDTHGGTNQWGTVKGVFIKMKDFIIANPQMLGTTESAVSKEHPRTKMPTWEIIPNDSGYTEVDNTAFTRLVTTGDNYVFYAIYAKFDINAFKYISFQMTDTTFTQRFPLTNNTGRDLRIDFSFGGKEYELSHSTIRPSIVELLLTNPQNNSIVCKKIFLHRF